MIAHLLAAFYAPIQDCDETFNYWEPLHYLIHGYGLQTWEYSPEFSIRSWAYILIHAVPTKIAAFLGKSKTFQFYLLRSLFAVVSGATQVRLYSAISRTLNPRIGVFYLIVVAFTPGFFYASTAFLPSSFAMYTSTLGLTAFMDWRGGSKTATGIFWFAMGASIGWPFAGALIIPFCVEDWIVAIMTNDMVGTFRKYLDGLIRCSLMLVWQIGIDFYFYKKFVIVPWRIVSYNVFSGANRGPDIFGTEPWHFYVKNLLLNFNMWFVLAISVVPLLILQAIFSKQKTSQQSLARTMVFITPFYLWFTIFTLQPHKEERFMFPAYPFLALNAAISFHMLLAWIGTSDPKTLIGKIPAQIKVVIVLPLVLLSVNVGLLRILGTITAYQAPLQVYQSLEAQSLTANDTVCFGKDWYRFPSSFHLPNTTHAKFIKSAFDGLLPGEFFEDDPNGPFRSGTWTLPSGMNDQNKEDPSKYVGLDQCTYLIDSQFPSVQPSAQEPIYAFSDQWQQIVCNPFLDAGSSGLIARTVWIPNLPFVPAKFRRVWGTHCLLRRKGPKS